MFDIGWSELVIIGIVALIAIGPKELPGVLRSLGHWMGKVRSMASEFQGQFREAMREAEVADLKKQFDDAQAAASNVTAGFDNPLDVARREMEKAVEDKPLTAPDAPPATTAADNVQDFPVPETPASVVAESVVAESVVAEEVKPDATRTEAPASEPAKGGSAA
jgi:sec-independent protein translocase protein TatB